MISSILKKGPMSFQKKKLVISMKQAPNLGGLLYGSKFEPKNKNQEVKNTGENCVSRSYLLKKSLHQFKRVNNTFLMKSSFNCESINPIHVVICQGCNKEYIEETECSVKERINIYRQHIRQCRNISNWKLKNIYVLVKTKSFICFLFSRFFKILSKFS